MYNKESVLEKKGLSFLGLLSFSKQENPKAGGNNRVLPLGEGGGGVTKGTCIRYMQHQQGGLWQDGDNKISNSPALH